MKLLKTFFRLKLRKSFLFFFSNLWKKRHYDVVFYYPAHFNRSEKGHNVYFEPLINICDKFGLKYIVIEEPELSMKVVRSSMTVPSDIVLITILVLRKLVPPRYFDSFEKREYFIAKILKYLYFYRFSFDNYIVLSQSLISFFHGLNPHAKLFDYQHGVITSIHTGYVTKDKTVPMALKSNNANVLVYGDAFKELMIRSTNEAYYEEHVFTVGQTLKPSVVNNLSSKTILVSLQFADPIKTLNEGMLNLLLELFESQYDFFNQNQIKVYLKHHPRFQNDIDPTPLYQFPFTELYQGTLHEALSKSFLQITFHSSSTFEAASMGIPTLLIKNSFLNPVFFETDYFYPIKIVSVHEIANKIAKYLKESAKYQTDSERVQRWYHGFYQQIDEEMFLKLLRGKI